MKLRSFNAAAIGYSRIWWSWAARHNIQNIRSIAGLLIS